MNLISDLAKKKKKPRDAFIKVRHVQRSSVFGVGIDFIFIITFFFLLVGCNEPDSDPNPGSTQNDMIGPTSDFGPKSNLRLHKNRCTC